MCPDNNDSGYTTSPNTRIQAKVCTTISTTQSIEISTHGQTETTSSASSDSFPKNREWDVLEEEAAQLRELQAMKEAELNKKYSTYVDSSPAFVFHHGKPSIPKTIVGIDRVLLETEMNNVVYKENKAIQQAKLYRDKCTQLEQQCRELETEKEAVHYFWRNKLVEGQTRAARMLKESLKSKS